jgi:hypothetical protein
MQSTEIIFHPAILVKKNTHEITFTPRFGAIIAELLDQVAEGKGQLRA